MISAFESHTYPFTVEPLAFSFDALEPYIDAATMRIHHETHHRAYVTNLNEALQNYPELHDLSIEELLRRSDELPATIRKTVREQGVGHLYHQYFWKILKPSSAGAKPSGMLARTITRDFGSFTAFKELFVDVGVRLLNSGWVFLVADTDGKLEVFSRSGHDNVVRENKTILLINDLWEHAYYLKYQRDRVTHRRDRADYLNAFWNVINWEFVNQRLESLYARPERLQLVS